MLLLKILFAALIFFGFLYWLIQLLLIIRITHSILSVEKMVSADLDKWPKVSLIMTARDEAQNIEATIGVRLKDTYPNIEFILIDDRSTDGTSEIFDNVASKDTRTKVVHVTELPEGWLGKINAMKEGLKIATGEWLLFSDADVHIQNGTIRKVIAYAEKNSLDHIAIIPELRSTNFIIDIISAVFVRLICLIGRIWAVQNPKSSAAVGSGSFNLVRRKALDITQGLEWLRLEPGDDVALGLMLKKSGAHQAVINGNGYVRVSLYKSLGDLAKGFERTSFTTLANFSFLRILIFSLVWFGLELAPFLIVIPGINQEFLVIGLITITLSIITSIAINHWLNRLILPALCWPIGMIFHIIFFIRASILTIKRKGIYWRGTFYPISLLKQGRRYRFK